MQHRRDQRQTASRPGAALYSRERALGVVCVLHLPGPPFVTEVELRTYHGSWRPLLHNIPTESPSRLVFAADPNVLELKASVQALRTQLAAEA